MARLATFGTLVVPGVVLRTFCKLPLNTPFHDICTAEFRHPSYSCYSPGGLANSCGFPYDHKSGGSGGWVLGVL